MRSILLFLTLLIVVSSFRLNPGISLPRILFKKHSVPVRLEGEHRTKSLAPVLANGWSMVDGRDAITKKFQFSDFVKAFGFMTQVAIHAEKHNHHPEWFNVYNNVDVTLSTHDCQGLSQNDVDMASIMDSIKA